MLICIPVRSRLCLAGVWAVRHRGSRRSPSKGLGSRLGAACAPEGRGLVRGFDSSPLTPPQRPLMRSPYQRGAQIRLGKTSDVPRTLIVTPTYNERDNLERFVSEVRAAAPS